MKRSSIMILHAGYWFVYLAIWGVVLTAISQSSNFANEGSLYYAGIILGVAIVPAVYSFYIFYFLLFPSELKRRKIFKALFAGLMVSLSSFLLTALTLRFSANMVWSCYGETNYIAIFIVAFISFLQCGAAFIIKGFITWFDDSRIKEALQKKNYEMELALIKSQLDPHFLFNTLNNIDTLILKNPEKASIYLNRLSDIMRFILFEVKTTEIPLQTELDYISKYIELQRIRTSNPTYVNYKVIGDPTNTTITPLVFIPIIENAFKHTNNKKLKDAINIKIQVNNNFVQMQCDNKIDVTRASKVERNGLGYELIFKRLKLLFPDRHQLEVKESNDLYSVSLICYS